MPQMIGTALSPRRDARQCRRDGGLVADLVRIVSTLALNRQFRAPAPNMLWVLDFTYVAT